MTHQSKYYIAYECMICHKTTILIKDEIRESQNQGRYITCAHDGRHAKLREIGEFDDLNKCMTDQRVYRRSASGAIKEIR